MISKSALVKGIKVEREHLKTYLWVEQYLKIHKKLPPAIDFYLHIAKDHLMEDGQYYEKLEQIHQH